MIKKAALLVLMGLVVACVYWMARGNFDKTGEAGLSSPPLERTAEVIPHENDNAVRRTDSNHPGQAGNHSREFVDPGQPAPGAADELVRFDYEAKIEFLRCAGVRDMGKKDDSCPSEVVDVHPDAILAAVEKAARAGNVEAMLDYGRAIDFKYKSYKEMLNDRLEVDRLLRINLEFLQRASRSGSDEALMQLYDRYHEGVYKDPNGVLAAAYLLAFSRAKPHSRSVYLLAQEALSKLPPNHAAEAVRMAEALRSTRS